MVILKNVMDLMDVIIEKQLKKALKNQYVHFDSYMNKIDRNENTTNKERHIKNQVRR